MTLTKRGPYWHFRFQVGGQDHRGSTKVKDRATAQLIEDQLRKDAILQPHGLGPAPSLGATIVGWIEAHKRVASHSHTRAAGNARNALGPLLTLPISHLTTSRVEAWRSTYLEGHSPAAANAALRYLKAFVNWAHRLGHVRVVAFDVKPLKVQRRPRPVVGVGNLEAFLRGVDLRGDAQVQAAIRVALFMGLREGEILSMRWDWLQGSTYFVGLDKGRKGRSVQVPAWVAPYLEALPRTSPLIFPGHAQGWLRKALARGCEAAGLPVMGIHRLRASCATLLDRTGASLPEIQAYLGHADIRTTMGYIEVGAGAQAEAQARLGQIARLG